eukprot:251902-Prorocentrum_minimum.AAC.2
MSKLLFKTREWCDNNWVNISPYLTRGFRHSGTLYSNARRSEFPGVVALGSTYTYGDILGAANQYASSLEDKFAGGVKQPVSDVTGPRVGVMAGPTAEYTVGMFAAWLSDNDGFNLNVTTSRATSRLGSRPQSLPCQFHEMGRHLKTPVRSRNNEPRTVANITLPSLTGVRCQRDVTMLLTTPPPPPCR